jgi:hypothetical protein
VGGGGHVPAGWAATVVRPMEAAAARKLSFIVVVIALLWVDAVIWERASRGGLESLFMSSNFPRFLGQLGLSSFSAVVVRHGNRSEEAVQAYWHKSQKPRH